MDKVLTSRPKRVPTYKYALIAFHTDGTTAIRPVKEVVGGNIKEGETCILDLPGHGPGLKDQPGTILKLSNDHSELLEAERDYDPENRPAFVSVNCISKNGNTGDDFDTKKNKRSNDYDSLVPQPAQKMARSTVTQTKRGIVMTHDASTQTVGTDLINVHTQVSADTVNAETSPIQPSSACSPTIGTLDTDISLSVRRALDFEEELPFDRDPAVSGGFLEFLNAPLIKEHERRPAPSDVTLQMLKDTVGIQSQMLTEMKVQLSQLTQQLQASQLTSPKRHHQETVTRPQLVPGAELATESTERPRYSESVDAERMNEMRSEVIEDGSYQYLSNETIMRLRASSRSDRNFAASMARELFSDAERLRPNVCVSGWGRSQTLSPVGIDKKC